MKAVTIALLFAAALSWAQDDKPTDPLKVLSDLMKANAEKDVGTIDTLMKSVIEVGQTSKSPEEVDPIAKELAISFKLAKGNPGIERKIIKAMGELRSRKTLGVLKRWAFRKKVKNEDQESLQVAAIDAIGLLRDPKLVDKIGDVSKSRSVNIAKAAYASLKNYGPSKGRVRRKIAELLMKRLSAEKPSTGQQGGSVSKEAQARWQKVERVMVESMQAVCREDTINDIENWREWWKENKRNPKTWKDKKKEKEG